MMTTPYRAELLRLPLDQARVAALRTAAGVRVHDVYEAQVEELVRSRTPARKLGGDALARAVADARIGPGVWAYYPWSGRLVHVLEEAEFAELRTDRNRYKILAPEQRSLSEKRVGVVGLSVGQSVALTMALERSFGEIRLADFDTLELSNVNRVRARVHELGLPKCAITAREIAEIDPYLASTCFFEGLTAANVDAFFLGPDGSTKLDLVVDECDDLAMKVLLREKARAYRVPVLMDTSDRGMLDVERFDLEPERPIFHGLLDGVRHEELVGLSTEQKVPYVTRIVGGLHRSSPRMVASLMEIGHTITTWPQLAADVTLGGAVAAETARRVLLGHLRSSGRWFVSPQDIVTDEAPAPASVAVPETIAHAGAAEGGDARPRLDAADDSLRRLVAAAILAPSGGNVQPWAFALEERAIAVHLDRSRSVPDALTDYRGLASHAALGAAVESMVLRAPALGLSASVAHLGGPPGPVARVALSPLEAGAQIPFSELGVHLEARHTSRRPAPRVPPTPALVDALRAATAHEGHARLEIVTDAAALAELGAILGSADRIRFLNERLHAELMGELRFDESEVRRTRDGIDLASLELDGTDRTGLLLCRRWAAMQLVGLVGGGATLEKPAKKALASASLAALVVTPGATDVHYFHGGRAMQRAWLAAVHHGYNVQPWSSLPYFFANVLRGDGDGFAEKERRELLALRARWQRLFPVRDDEGEVLLFIVNGAPPASVRALRLPVDAVLR